MKSKHPSFTPIWISLGLGIFSAIYIRYSHGVSSPYMLFLFAIPLAGALLQFLAGLYDASSLTRFSLHAATATFGVGSLLQGVVEIYGTQSPLIAGFGWLGLAWLGVAWVSLILHLTCSHTPVDPLA